MQKIKLGKTGLTVTKMGFGGIPIQRVDEGHAVAAVLNAISSGVDFIDTARAYTTSERKIGLALKQSSKKVVLASKSQNRSSDGIREDIEKSLEELQRDYIDIYQCHNVSDRDVFAQIVKHGGALDGLLHAKSEGVIGHIGLTSHSLDLLDYALDQDIFETIMLCFSFLEPAAREKVIPKAIEKNVGIICMKPFSGGVIDNIELALKFVLSHDKVLIIPGVENTNLFDENWKVFLGDHNLSDKEKQEIADIRNKYDKLFCRRCDYCQPCTEDIPIQTILGIRQIVARFGDNVISEGGWALKGIEKAKNCSECGDCMTRCPYDLPIPHLIKEAVEWVSQYHTP